MLQAGARGLFTAMSFTSRGLRSTLMGLATGTRGANVVYFNPSETHLVALTIDDAPSRSAEEFRELLDLLRELGVRVTFQVISGHVLSDVHKELLKRAVSDGHQLTNHTTLDERCIKLTRDAFRSRLADCQSLLDDVAPNARRWFRPPCGLMNATMRSVCAEEGYSICLGDCYSSDPDINDVEYHATTLLRCASAGSVIIVHCPEEGLRHQTLEVVPKLVQGLRERGLQLATLDELFPATVGKDKAGLQTAGASAGGDNTKPPDTSEHANCCETQADRLICSL